MLKNLEKILVETPLDIIAIKKIEEAKLKVKKDLNADWYKHSKVKMYEKIENLAKMMFILKLSVGEIAPYYNKTTRSIESWLTKLGWSRDRIEAQQIAAKRTRDYTKIRRTFKKTMLERFDENQLFGSRPEQFARHKLNIELSCKLPKCEIIVGVNNVSIIDKEIDIPIIIFSKDKIYKYAVEVDGIVFHKVLHVQDRDFKKTESAIKKGYTIFNIYTKSYYSNQDKNKAMNKQIGSQIDRVINYIVEEVNSNRIIDVRNKIMNY